MADEIEAMASERSTVLVLIGAFLPGFRVGGPVQSTANLVAALGGEYRFKILCGDRDLGDARPFDSDLLGKWIEEMDYSVFRLPSGVRGLFGLWRHLREDRYDVLYLNGFCDRKYSMFPMFLNRLRLIPARPTILAGRGEFSAGALGIRAVRKHVYLWLARVFGLFDFLVIHAATEYERADIHRHLGGVSIVTAGLVPRSAETAERKVGAARVQVASDVPGATKALPVSEVTPQKEAGRLRVVTVARISRMKNITYALKILEGVKGYVEYDIYGPCEDREYFRQCRELAGRLPANIRVRFPGEIAHSEVSETLMNYHMFFLPTLGENFCHSIVEAMAVGRPLLISDRTPWRNLCQEGVGWDLPLEFPEKFVDAFHEAVSWTHDEFGTYVERCWLRVSKDDQYGSAIRENRDLLRSVLGLT